MPSDEPPQVQSDTDGRSTQSVLIPEFTLIAYTSMEDYDMIIDHNELENIIQRYLDEQFALGLPQSQSVDVELTTVALPKVEMDESEFVLSGHLECIENSCPPKKQINAILTQSLLENYDQLLSSLQSSSDPMLQSLVEIDVSSTETLADEEVVVFRSYQQVEIEEEPAKGIPDKVLIPLLVSLCLVLFAVVIVLLRRRERGEADVAEDQYVDIMVRKTEGQGVETRLQHHGERCKAPNGGDNNRRRAEEGVEVRLADSWDAEIGMMLTPAGSLTSL